MRNRLILSIPPGRLCLTEEDGALVSIQWTTEADETTGAPSPLLREAAAQLTDYIRGKRRHFDLPLHPAGTPFQQQVWAALLRIPYGETRSYARIAADIGRPKAVRAVGGACHRNPIGIVIPCHRVVGSDGSLTGYAGGTDIKRFLLQTEQTYLR